jgi:hypothetical protein
MLLSLLLVPLVALSSVHAQDVSEPISLPCDASIFSPPDVDGAKILSITTETKHEHTTYSGGPLFPPVSDLNFCSVKVTLNHPGTTDSVLVEIWLPLTREDWNGRFQATGGGGYATGLLEIMLGPAVRDGYAAASTNGGHPLSYLDLDWVLMNGTENKENTVNWNLLQNFATRSLVDMVYVGKSITEQYFGQKPHHSYWNGCSQGGRQGYMMAQKYPGLLDGILAVAPAIELPGLAMADFWPQLLMIELETFVSNCEFSWFGQKAMDQCDMLDGVHDGVITDPEVCDFEPSTLVGEKFECDGEKVEVTQIMADIVRKIQEGPVTPYGASLWPGLPYGTSSQGLANINISPEGVRSPSPFGVASSYIQNLLLKDSAFNISTLTYEKYVALWAQSALEFGWILDAAETDLSNLKNSGTKLLSWHGINDQIIPYKKTVQYRERVELEMGGAKSVDEYFRLFLAPGVMHCGLGAGPLPKRPLEQLEDWVEKGEAPEFLEGQTKDAEGDLVSRDLCRWPRKMKYMGIGDAKRASSWSCEGEEEFEDLSGSVVGVLGDLKERLMGLGMGLKIQQI